MVKDVKMRPTQTYNKLEDVHAAHPHLKRWLFSAMPQPSGHSSFPVFCSLHPAISLLP